MQGLKGVEVGVGEPKGERGHFEDAIELGRVSIFYIFYCIRSVR